jgi:ribonuclease P protein component
MTSAPEAASASPAKGEADQPPAPSDSTRPFSILQKRRDFLAAARARRWATPGMVVQGRQRAPDEAPGEVRVGYTCSKKVGNAVARNRAKRRLRAAAAEAIPRHGRPGWDYVLIGRSEATAARPFPDLVADLEVALDRLHAGKGRA